MFISGTTQGFYKHWRYFKYFFFYVEQVFITEKRIVMVFPTCSPLGLRVVRTAPFIYEIDPEYLPENKIRSAVFSYNFERDKGFKNQDENYIITDSMFKYRDMFYYDSLDQGLPGWNHIMGFDFLRNFYSMQTKEDENTEDDKPTYLAEKLYYLTNVFEEILSIPESLMEIPPELKLMLMEENGIQPYETVMPPASTFNDMVNPRAVASMTAYMQQSGFWYFPMCDPTKTYVGTDSSIVGVNLKNTLVDIALDRHLMGKELAPKILEDFPMISMAKELLETLKNAFNPPIDTKFSKYQNGMFDVLMRMGPHCYTVTTGQGITYPDIAYDEEYFFFNQKKVAAGDQNYLKGQILEIYDNKYFLQGSVLYEMKGQEPSGPEPSSGTEERDSMELEVFMDFDGIPYNGRKASEDYIVGKKEEDDKTYYYFLADWLNHRYIKKESDIEPVITFGDWCMVGVEENGSLRKFTEFFSLWTERRYTEKQVMKEDEEGNLTEVDVKVTEETPDPGFYYYFKALPREVVELYPGHKSFFAKTETRDMTEYFFLTNTSNVYCVKTVHENYYDNWYIYDVEDADAHKENGYAYFNELLEEDKSDITREINEKIDDIKVIKGMVI